LNDVTELLARVEAATRSDRKIDHDLYAKLICTTPELQAHLRGVDASNSFSYPFYTASIDDALALVERMLPGWFWRTGRMTAPHWQNGSYADYWCHLQRTHSDHCDREDESTGFAHTPATAILAALLRALSPSAPTQVR